MAERHFIGDVVYGKFTDTHFTSTNTLQNTDTEQWQCPNPPPRPPVIFCQIIELRQSHFSFLADLGEAKGCSTNTFVTDWFIHAQTVINGASSHKQTILTFFWDSKSWRASKSLYWFKSSGYFAEWVDFADWWSCIALGRVCACSLPSRLVCVYIGYCSQPALPWRLKVRA